MRYRSISYIASFHGILLSLKSLLDMYARLCYHLIWGKNVGRGFNKGKVKSVEISGGRVINHLLNSCPSDYDEGEELAKVIENHSKKWITKAIYYRDQVAHTGNIKEFLPLRVEFVKSSKSRKYKIEELMEPKIDKMPIVIYADLITDNTSRFLVDSIKLLPNVDMSYLDLKEKKK